MGREASLWEEWAWERRKKRKKKNPFILRKLRERKKGSIFLLGKRKKGSKISTWEGKKKNPFSARGGRGGFKIGKRACRPQRRGKSGARNLLPAKTPH